MTKLHIDKKSIGSLFSELKGKKFIIPDYQRPYKWTVKNVQQLIDDLLTHFRDSKVYRIGTIVLYKNDGKSEIVDGQQRLTTLSLLLYKLGKKDILFLNEKFNHSISKFNIGKL